MTVIAVKDGIMAADTASWDGDIKIGRVQKIVRLSDGSLVAGTGRGPLVEAYNAWVRDGAERPPEADKEDDFGAIHLTGSGVFIVDEHYRESAHGFEFYASGSHSEFLYGAMAAGASAEEAVRLALKYCGFAGGEVQVERLGPVTISASGTGYTQTPPITVTSGGTLGAGAQGWTLGGSLEGKVGD